MIETLAILLLIYTAGYAFLNYQVWSLRKALASPAWTWLLLAFSLMLANLLWTNVEFAYRIVTGSIPTVTLTPVMIFRLARQFVFAYAALGAFILGFHRLHRDLERIKE